MNREEALAKATVIVESIGNNKVDGWQTPILAQRTEAILKLAEFLMTEDQPPTRLVPPITAKFTIFGWDPYDSDSPPSVQAYKSAKATLATWQRNPGLVYPAEYVDAIGTLIETYEQHAPQAGPPA